MVSTHEPVGEALVSAEGEADSAVLAADDDEGDANMVWVGSGDPLQAARAPATTHARSSAAREDVEITRPTLRGRSAGLQVGSTMVG